MACPYFMPVAKLVNGSWPHPSRLPLGCGWSGHCTAPGHEDAVPPQDILQAFCNLGYASSCTWAPSERTWDAVRFSVSAPGSNSPNNGRNPFASEPSRTLRLIYVCERDHRPVVQGDLEFDVSQATWLRKHADARVQKMAECFLESYLKK